ncbi:MAG TPA: NPCBM/NEW2 domain-containing protein [Pirellulaceae bacterium]|nr:NPCBM/NEW2 domain-containing protein [Pirellulaceae bacterium]
MTVSRSKPGPTARVNRWLMVGTAFLVALASTARGIDVVVEPLSGEKLEGALKDLTSDKVAVSTAAGEQTLAIKDVQSLQFAAAASAEKPGVWLELLDGSQLVGHSFQSAEGQAQVELLSGAPVQMPTRSIRWVRFHEQDAALAEQWQKIIKGTPESDLLVVRKISTRTIEQPGQEPRSVIETALDELDGTVLEVGLATAKFDFSGDVIDVKREKNEGIVYFHPVKRELPPPVCRVIDAGRSSFSARSIELMGDRLNLVSPAGVSVSIPLSQLSQIDFSSGNVKFLSDLAEEASLADASFQPRNMTATFKQLKAPRKDHPFGGEALSIGGKKLSRGLALSGRTRLAYRVPEGMRWFRADVGLDDLAGPAANLTLIILGDSREVYRQTFSAEDERKPRSIEIDLAGCGRLTIVVEDGQGLDIADQLDLANARFTK